MDLEGSPHSPDGDTDMLDQIPKHHRSTRSLHLLTTKFLSLLQQAEGGVLDLKNAHGILAGGQKRRIYDITNVLEGIGLIVKISKNTVKWIGASPGAKSFESSNRLMWLKSELMELEQKENMLDQQKFWVEQSIRNTIEDCSNLTYVNHEDICNCFRGHTLLAVRAPSGTQLDVPIPKAVLNRPVEYQIHLKSVNGPIDVVLLNKSSVSSAPVVLPVPPPDDILRRAKLAMYLSGGTESSSTPCQPSSNTRYNTTFIRAALEDIRRQKSLSVVNTEPDRTDAGVRNLSKELEEIVKPTKELMKAELIRELLTSEILSPILRLPSPPSDKDYGRNLDESEGLFDIPVLNV